MSASKTHKNSKSIALLGGTFDPIHKAHLYIAEQAKQKLKVDICALMPCGQAFHKKNQHVTDKAHRLTMIQMALSEHPSLTLETCELEEEKPSITLETLKALKQKHPNNTYIYLMGEDVFAGIDAWDDWPELIQYSHIVLINRHNPTHQQKTPKAWQPKLTADIEDLHKKTHGHVLQLSIPPYILSSSNIRSGLKAKQNRWLEEVPESVKRYILKHHLYKAQLT
jgi:nicotinate-nucleotide adenylyltransferase